MPENSLDSGNAGVVPAHRSCVPELSRRPAAHIAIAASVREHDISKPVMPTACSGNNVSNLAVLTVCSHPRCNNRLRVCVAAQWANSPLLNR